MNTRDSLKDELPDGGSATVAELRRLLQVSNDELGTSQRLCAQLRQELGARTAEIEDWRV